jgi:hypothetical protein
MGMFLSMTSVVGKTKDEVANSLNSYAKSVDGGIKKENLSIDDNNCCVIDEANGNTTIFNPYAYLEWDRPSAFISKNLEAPVFSFHIHDGDLWTYTLFVKGEIADQFIPIPDYWDENISEEEIQSWKGNAATIASYISSIKPADIERYLVRWDLDAEENEKAYADDEFAQEDWQLLDFMRKLGLPYPLNDDGTPKGETYILWTKELPLKLQSSQPAKKTPTSNDDKTNKPWWKFW